MNRSILLIVVALMAGALGFAGGFLVLLAVTGLERAGWVPVAQLTGAGLAAGLGVGLVARIETGTGLRLAAAGTLAGAALGLAVAEWGDLEWAIGAAAALVLGLVAAARSLVQSA